ncbi:hypothetical protein HPB51_011512 [Rhipicephalus microplus]|uniref:Transposable element P transposase-like RNase H domain-containing protein n=1 Tax=Rhipicephalus microplus TaxID=6941 RepID=A0A9J6E075_RHIMP|nr:hypothetical protein HPB51_011512 [Rhipicephalus microplus]
MAYDKLWVLEFISTRMKSAQLYEHICKHEIMALPSKTCLDKHLPGFESTFRFNPKVFSALEQKTKDVDEFSLHEGLVFDELKLSENIAVKASGEFSCFVDLGNFSEPEEKTSLSDNGLNIMFQPFQGTCSAILFVSCVFSSLDYRLALFSDHAQMAADVSQRQYHVCGSTMQHCDGAPKCYLDEPTPPSPYLKAPEQREEVEAPCSKDKNRMTQRPSAGF